MIGNQKNTKAIIKKNDFRIKKKLGQNFLTDASIIDKILDIAKIDKNTAVIEVGPGLGSMTEKMIGMAKKVLAYEIDSDLIPILESNFKECDNFILLHQDILKAHVKKDIEKYLSDCDNIIFVSNLPYYITTPILTNLIEQDLNIKSYTVMVQKEVGYRYTSKPNTKDYNSLSIAIAYRTKPSLELIIPKEVFIPMPNVDSAIIRLETLEKPFVDVSDESMFFKFVRASFTQRRKTLVNNLSLLGYDKEYLKDLLVSIDILDNARAETLSINKFSELFNKIDSKKINT